MINKRGYTVQQRIEEEIEQVNNIDDKAKKSMLAAKVLGAADLAVEFDLITYKEWEKYIERIFQMI